jgi:hypothetical protein
MESYKERILKSIEDSDVGLTTVDVAKRAGISKTTVIKYLSVLRSEGLVEFAEVGPAKLWRMGRMGSATEVSEATHAQIEPKGEFEAMPVVYMDLCDGDDKTIYFSFKISPDQICALMKRSNKCACRLDAKK